MTTADALESPGSARTAASGGERPKAVLICPRCGHESPVDGDWTEVLRRDRVAVLCPVCDAHLTSRPVL